MPDLLFTSDSHVGHAHLVGGELRTRRPFSTIEEHDEALVAAWNAAVGPEDTVWHLGDFCYRCSDGYARSVFARLNGSRRFLVRGNRDRTSVRLPWDGIYDVAHVPVPRANGTVRKRLLAIRMGERTRRRLDRKRKTSRERPTS